MKGPRTYKLRGRLTAKPGSLVAADGTRGMTASVADTEDGPFGDAITFEWLGKEATEFYERHRHELVAGRSLDLELFGIFGRNSQLRARVKTCEMAPLPPSWIKHAEKMNPPQTPTTSTSGLRIV